ncbi:MAG: type I DNA topoisomerase [Gammaproteobacteria bacterium]|nr:type I DNA topoisomerase [Gammaproteobacteria bacterium]
MSLSRLVIVESPNKCKKIQSYLGQGWVVKASMGHVRDLPEKEMGVDLETFRPSYVATTKGRKVLAGLRASVKSARTVYLAMDPDREGEAIAWHLAEALNLKDAKRITFNEITRKAVQKAIQETGEIDRQQVAAQECRRILDRLVGYSVSPALSNAYGSWLTAGRVQSVAVRIVAEREIAIQQFTPESYVEVFLYFISGDIAWRAQWVPGDLQGKDQKHWTDKPFAQRVAALKEMKVVTVSENKQSRRPPPPFITSSLQQAASVSLKISPKKCMQIAQQLFEAGLITYHRTDNPNLSDEGIADATAWLSSNGYSIADSPNHWKAKAGAQEGHEAIRPTSVECVPDAAADQLDVSQQKLYRLIWLRAVASQMKDAVFNVTKINLSSVEQIDGKTMAFVAQRRLLLAQGWMALTKMDFAEEQATGKDDKNQLLPKIDESALLTADTGEAVDKKTKPPSRYTEATLIRKLENEGIGRPSTYASIIDNIMHRKYVLVTKRKLKATDLGITIFQALKDRFQFIELEYTRNIESQLNLIAMGQATYREVVSGAYAQLASELGSLSNISIGNQEKHDCPDCNQPLRLIQGKFWGCSSYPECHYSAPDDKGSPGVPRARETQSDDAQYPCTCGDGFMRSRQSRGKTFWGCSSYPECKNTLPDDKGKPSVRVDSNTQHKVSVAGDVCPECAKGSMVKRAIAKGRKNEGKPFLGCTNFPDCRYFTWTH